MRLVLRRVPTAAVADPDRDIAAVALEGHLEEVVAELVAMLDRVLAGLVAGHDDVLGLVLVGRRLAQPAAQRLAHREQSTRLAGDLEPHADAERLAHPHHQQRDVVRAARAAQAALDQALARRRDVLAGAARRVEQALEADVEQLAGLLDEAVGVEHDRRARLEHRRVLGVARRREHPHRR